MSEQAQFRYFFFYIYVKAGKWGVDNGAAGFDGPITDLAAIKGLEKDLIAKLGQEEVTFLRVISWQEFPQPVNHDIVGVI